MLPVIEMFASIQGEGKYMGVPSFFVRVSGCNLKCIFKGSICDTPYSSFTPEKSPYKTMDDLVNAFNKMRDEYPKVKHLVITGGEPLLYKKDLEQFLNSVGHDYVITIETNGTMPPLNPLAKNFKIDLYSVSPKLHTSVGKIGDKLKVGKDEVLVTGEIAQHQEKTRLNYRNLVNIATTANDYQFKFVYSGPECIAEIEDIYTKMAVEVEKEGDYFRGYYFNNHPNKHTMLMPEGVTKEQLDSNSEDIINECMKRGWTYTDRLQIRIWGDKRGV